MELEDEVERVERQFITAGKQFTALDVGNELKRRGINVRQRQVSPIVRQHYNETGIYEDADYIRQMIPVKNGECQAFLYSHVFDDPDRYTNRDQDPLPYVPKDNIDDIGSVLLVYFTTGRNMN